jgi:hypothetical protein
MEKTSLREIKKGSLIKNEAVELRSKLSRVKA